ncbi:MAG: hypothetical protein A2283_07820 [Lentisphaerae bacterium RIFOXYA12_FULL_48_11]|nr:MAG: hypothetical protein A2283_07820 [Lentisphaerae bacterium RIFOXYA12_FULL_48_11]
MKRSDTETEEAIVARARQVLKSHQQAQWLVLALAILMLGFCMWCFLKLMDRLSADNVAPLTQGFVEGFALAFVMSTFGIIGVLCLVRFLHGTLPDTKMFALLVKYHDENEELKKSENTSNKGMNGTR